jgi:hypothetical protein
MATRSPGITATFTGAYNHGFQLGQKRQLGLLQRSALNRRTFVRPGMAACVARSNAQNSVDLVVIGMDRSYRGPECNFGPIP